MTVDLDDAFAQAPLFPVLRGLTPEEAGPVGDALIDAGARFLEVTLDSPSPFESLRLLAKRHGPTAIVAAGTVLTVAAAQKAAEAGARMIVSPNCAPAVIAATRAKGAWSVPGVMTPGEAFAALEAGADALKLFPGEVITPPVVKSIRAVLPRGTRLVVTGGVGPQNIAAYLAAGAVGVGAGSSVFAPGRAPGEVGAAAARLIALARGGAAK